MVYRKSCLHTGVLLLTCALYTYALNSDYPPRFKPECLHWDSCWNMRQEYRRDFTQRNCECDNLCTAFKDCCIDAKARIKYPYHFKNRLDTCFRYGIYDEAIYVVGTCPRNYTDSVVVKRSCEGRDDFKDPIMSIPVSDEHSATTYRNRYCALCNGAPAFKLKPWRMYLKFDDSHPQLTNAVFVMRKDFIFSHYFKKWGIYANDTFRPFEFVFQKPESVSDVRYCRPNLISSCPPNWQHEYVRKSCQSYMGVVHHEHDTYRNVHCAICNGVDLSQLTCYEHIRIARFVQSDPFTLLLVTNLGQKEHIGRRRKCRYGQIYDRFRKICRKLPVTN